MLGIFLSHELSGTWQCAILAADLVNVVIAGNAQNFSSAPRPARILRQARYAKYNMNTHKTKEPFVRIPNKWLW